MSNVAHLTDLESEIHSNYQQYTSILNRITAFNNQDGHRINLISKVTHYIELINVMNQAEIKHKAALNEVKQLRNSNRTSSRPSLSHNKISESSKSQTDTNILQKKYNQLLIEFNMTQNENRNLEKSITEMKTKLQKSLSVKNDRFQQRANFSTTPYLSKIKHTPTVIRGGGKTAQINPPKTLQASPRRPSTLNPRTSTNRPTQSTPITTMTPLTSSKAILLNLSAQKGNALSPTLNRHKENTKSSGTEGVLKSLFDDANEYENKDDENSDNFSFTKLNKINSNISTSRILLKRKIVEDDEFIDNDFSPIREQRSNREDDEQLMSPIYKRIKQSQSKSSIFRKSTNPAAVVDKESVVNSPLKKQNELFKKSIFR